MGVGASSGGKGQSGGQYIIYNMRKVALSEQNGPQPTTKSKPGRQPDLDRLRYALC